MAVYTATNSAGSSASSTATVTLPTWTVGPSDLILIAVFEVGNNAFTTPAGYEIVEAKTGSADYGILYAKPAVSGDSGATVNIGLAASDLWAVHVRVYTNAYIDVASELNGSTASTTGAFAAATPKQGSSAGSIAVEFFCGHPTSGQTDTLTMPSGYGNSAVIATTGASQANVSTGSWDNSSGLTANTSYTPPSVTQSTSSTYVSFFVAVGSWGSTYVVQTVVATPYSGAPTITIPSVGAGHLLTLCATDFDNTLIGTLTDNQGDTWVQAKGQSGNNNIDMWYCLSATGGTTILTLGNVGSSSGRQSVIVQEWSCGATLDQTYLSSATTSNNPPVPAVTPAQNLEIAVVQLANDAQVTTPGNNPLGWTGNPTFNSTDASGYGMVAWQLTGTGTLSGSWTASGSPTHYTGAMLFIPATSSGLALAGASTDVSTVTGTLTSSEPLTASSAAVSTLTASLSIPLPLGAATSASVSTLSATLAALDLVSGSTASVSAASGSLTVAQPLAGTAASLSTLTGTLKLTEPLTGSSVSVTAVTGTLTAGGAPLTGAMASVSTVAGTLSCPYPLTAATAAVSTVTGTLSAGLALAGAILAVSTAVGTLNAGAAGALTATTSSVSTVTGSLSCAYRLGTAAITAVSAVSAPLTCSLRFTGSTVSVSTASGTATATLALSGTVTALSTTTATLASRLALTGTTSSVTVATGALSAQATSAPLTGTIRSVTTLTGALSAVAPLQDVVFTIGQPSSRWATGQPDSRWATDRPERRWVAL